jgi:hypothetical protein
MMLMLEIVRCLLLEKGAMNLNVSEIKVSKCNQCCILTFIQNNSLLELYLRHN